jgi:hypothetical protein
MARDFRRPERRQSFLLPPDMQDWLQSGTQCPESRARCIISPRRSRAG